MLNFDEVYLLADALRRTALHLCPPDETIDHAFEIYGARFPVTKPQLFSWSSGSKCFDFLGSEAHL